jgi:regulator of sigma E protease
VVLAIDGRPVESFSDMQRIVSANAGRTLQLKIDRGGAPITLTATPALKEGKDGFGNNTCQAVLGVSRSMAPGDIKTEQVDPVRAVWFGAKETWFIIDRTFSYIGGLFAGRECADQLGGPIRIAQISGQVATLGFMPVLHLAAMLSVSIGLLNLFPVPLLDGGHLLFYAAEVLRGRPLSERTQEYGFRVGLAMVLMLMVFAFWNDAHQVPWLKSLFG